MDHQAPPPEDIEAVIVDDMASHVSSGTTDAFEALDKALSIKPSSKKDVATRDKSVNSAISVLKDAILTDVQTFEGKEYIQKNLKRMIDMGINLLGEIEKDFKNGGVQPRTIEVFSTLMNSTTVACHQLTNLMKLAAEAHEYKSSSGGGQSGASITETHTRTLTMGPREMSEFIAKAQKDPSLVKEITSVKIST